MLGGDDPMIAFAYQCLRREYHQLLEHRPAKNEAPSAEDIHRTRIAARRLRVGLKLFSDMLPGTEADRLNQELRWFAHSLGDVRDLDVYTERLRKRAECNGGDGADLKAYEQEIRAACNAARRALPQLYAGARYAALIDSLARFLLDAPNAGALRRWRSFRVADGANAYLSHGIKAIVKRGDKVVTMEDPGELHALRIKAKRLRYALEFFAEIFPSLAPAAAATKRLQDVLGEHQDAVTAGMRLRDVIDARGETPSPALQALLAHHVAEAADARRRFSTEWRRFKRSLSPAELRELLAA